MDDQRPIAPEESQRDSQGRLPAAAGYLILGALLLFLVRPADLSDEYQIGRSIGTLLMSILISYGIWALIRKVRGSGEKWSPWVLFIALFVATIARGVPQSESAASPEETSASSPQVETLGAEDVFADLPGLRYEPVPPQALEQARRSYFSDPAAAESLLDVDGRLVFERRRQVGVLVAVFSTAEAAATNDFRAGFFQGFEDSVRDQGGGALTEHALAGTKARGGPTSEGYALSFIYENAAISVLGGDQATAELIATRVLRKLDQSA